ncbi:hypothetical protein GCM10010254_42870 [Streptomyces chromofuscus]|nr:hypothetical protein GCM10010254_42870 [Streptomyces chromofuscus]
MVAAVPAPSSPWPILWCFEWGITPSSTPFHRFRKRRRPPDREDIDAHPAPVYREAAAAEDLAWAVVDGAVLLVLQPGSIDSSAAQSMVDVLDT